MADGFTFYLGTHLPTWLSSLDLPLFVSRNRLCRIKRKYPKARGRWALDSGGFTELSQHGLWRSGAKAYADEVTRYADEIGKLEWAAPQDWMCEPWIIKKTGLSVAEHQKRTVENYIELRSLGIATPIIPVLQGWERSEYLEHVEMYQRYGIDLSTLPLVGLGSVCRRQREKEAGEIIHALRGVGLTKLHGFGFKKTGIRRYGSLLKSADSMAWSYAARRDIPLAGCVHKSCANCQRYALMWRSEIAIQRQLFLF